MGPDAAPHLRDMFADTDDTRCGSAPIAADCAPLAQRPGSAGDRRSRSPRGIGPVTSSYRRFSCLGRLGWMISTGRAVLALLHHEDFPIRAAAVRTVGQLKIRSGSGGSPRSAFVDDESRWVCASRSAGPRKSWRELPTLKSLADSGHPRARLARQALLERGIDRWIA